MSANVITLESIARGFRYALDTQAGKPRNGPRLDCTPAEGAIVVTRAFRTGEKWLPFTHLYRKPRHYILVCDWFIAPEYSTVKHVNGQAYVDRTPSDTLSFTAQYGTRYFMACACSPLSAGDTPIDLGLVHESDLIEAFLNLEYPQ